MKILVLKDKPLEYQTFPLYAEDGTTPLGNLVEVSDELIGSGNPLMFDGEKVCIDSDAIATETAVEQNEEIMQEISKNKMFLTETDYMLFKVVDKAMPAEEYEPVRIQRAEARQKINELQNKLI